MIGRTNDQQEHVPISRPWYLLRHRLQHHTDLSPHLLTLHAAKTQRSHLAVAREANVAEKLLRDSHTFDRKL
jgi:hypothetical protein